ncbi:MAG: threonine synthase [Candidatus Bipolaricaulis sp.]|nr:threonine synthase [Candidatus Bipolaricaulis sp.]MDD5218983.1 threonine synthase [Candidatus Bipolaricaulis sp.]MDD5645975.1 threonine synthase [Candidatus Bipolaricaulis sp.]
MGEIATLRCVTCGVEYDPTRTEYTCPSCGPRRGTLEVLYDYDRLRRTLHPSSFAETGLPSMWRYEALLPIEDRRFIQPLRVGWTPLYAFPELARELRLAALHVKDDGQNPTASYKDRASSIVVIKAQEKRKGVVTCASTGNAASSLAGFAASTALETVIFVPERAPEAKVAQLLVYGARVFLVRGSYDVAYDLAAEAATAFGWYNRSAAVNPYLVEGKKTGALEIAEQLAWNPPHVVLVGVGDGSVVSGLCKGFDELVRLGWLEHAPRVIGVQAEGSAAIARASAAYRGRAVAIEDGEARTVADSICVGKPRDIVKAVTYVARNGGEFVTVSDAEILDAIVTLARRTGVFAEPAGAASFAGLRKLAAAGTLEGKTAAVVVSGNGLKDVASPRAIIGAPIVVEPSLKEIERHL